MNIQKQAKREILRYIHSRIAVKTSFLSREEFLETKIVNYADEFIARLKKHGCTELGEDLNLYPWLEELATGLSDLRIHHAATTGNAQCGKSLINTLLLCDFFLQSALDCLWFYPTKTQLDNLVPNMFGRVIRNYEQKIIDNLYEETGQKIAIKNTNDKENNNIFQRRGASIHFRYASTSAKDHTETKSGLAVVGGSAASISGNILFIDERSQIPPDALSTLFRRLDAARLPGGIIREIGTPGSGLGIESLIDVCTHHFYPHIKCKHCGAEIELNPKGCLLIKDGDTYLSVTGRPSRWFHSDPDDKVNSAYIACSSCKHPITDEERKNAYFKCLKTGEIFKDFRETLPTEIDKIFKHRQLIIFHLSPLLRQSKKDIAVDIISTGINTDSTRDYQQQVLGFASENDAVKITRRMLKDATEMYPPEKPHTCIVAGIDQGRHQDWMVIYKVWIDGFEPHQNGIFLYKSSKDESPVVRIENAKREVLFISPVKRSDIKRLLRQYSVDLGFIDAEPGIAGAYELSKHTNLLLADQKRNNKKLVQETQFYDGAMAIPGYNIDENYFKDMVLNSYMSKNVFLLPINTTDKSPNSPARHLTSPEKDLDNNTWIRPNDKIDDLFMASMFAEVALHHRANTWVEKSETSLAWYLGLRK